MLIIISQRNEHTRKRESKDQISSMYQQAFDQLITEIQKDLTENGKAFYISSLLERFKALFPDDVSSENYSGAVNFTRKKPLYNHNLAKENLT